MGKDAIVEILKEQLSLLGSHGTALNGASQSGNGAIGTTEAEQDHPIFQDTDDQVAQQAESPGHAYQCMGRSEPVHLVNSIIGTPKPSPMIRSVHSLPSRLLWSRTASAVVRAPSPPPSLKICLAGHGRPPA